MWDLVFMCTFIFTAISVLLAMFILFARLVLAEVREALKEEIRKIEFLMDRFGLTGLADEVD